MIRVAVTASTNEDLARLARDGAPHGTAFLADRQTAGRGRLGRTWESPPGNVCLSVLVRLPIGLDRAPLVCLGAAVAVVEASGAPVAIKWPNDVLAPDDRKVAGILAEVDAIGTRVQWIAVGIGVNVSATPPGMAAACLAEIDGRKRDPVALAEAIADGVLYWAARIPEQPEVLLDRWRELSCTLGRRVRIGAIEGDAVDVDTDGALLVLGDQGLQRVLAGDVDLLPRVIPTDPGGELVPLMAAIPYFAFATWNADLPGIGAIPFDPWATLVCIGFVVGLEIARNRGIKLGLDVRDIVDGAVFIVLMGFLFGHILTVVAYYPDRMYVKQEEITFEGGQLAVAAEVPTDAARTGWLRVQGEVDGTRISQRYFLPRRTGSSGGYVVAVSTGQACSLDVRQAQVLLVDCSPEKKTIATRRITGRKDLGNAFSPWAATSAILRIWEGFASTGGFIGAVIGATLFYLRIRPRDFWRHADVITFGFPFGWFFGRLGCGVVHDHVGRQTTFALAMDFDHGMVADTWKVWTWHMSAGDPATWASGIRHELGLYEAAYMLGVCAIWAWLGRQDRVPGMFMGLFAVLYAPVRFGLEFLRNVDLEHQDARYLGLTPAQYGSFLILGAGIAILATRDWKGFRPTSLTR